MSQMARGDGVQRVLIVSIILCLFCSIVVSAAAVLLKPEQQINRNRFKQENVLAAAGLLNEGQNVQQLFNEYVETRIIDLKTGEYADHINPQTYDQYQSARDAATGAELPGEEDIASIKRQARYAPVYLVRKNGEVQYYIFPIHGYGLWSTLYGFIALESDLNTVYGISFYQHAETPGLGGEVDNPSWKAKWHGKKIYANGDEPALRVIKGNVDSNSPKAGYQVDGLAGATLTSRGVSNIVQFWFGENGYRPYLERLKTERG